jgi:hypothetical protein
MTTTDAYNLAANYMMLWTEPDPSVRRQAIKELWVEDGVEHAGVNQYRGHDAIEGRITTAHGEFFAKGENLLQLADAPVTNDDAATFTMQIVATDGGPATWTGRIFMLLDPQYRILADYQFDITSS